MGVLAIAEVLIPRVCRHGMLLMQQQRGAPLQHMRKDASDAVCSARWSCQVVAGDITEAQASVRPPTTLCLRMGSYSDLRWGLSGTLRRYRTTTFLKAGSWISRGLNRFSNTFAASGMMLRSERLTTVCAQQRCQGMSLSLVPDQRGGRSQRLGNVQSTLPNCFNFLAMPSCCIGQGFPHPV